MGLYVERKINKKPTYFCFIYYVKRYNNENIPDILLGSAKVIWFR